MLDGAKYLRGINRGCQGGIASIAGTGCIHEAKFKSGFFSTGPRRFRECVHLKPVLLEQSPFQVGCKQTCGFCRKPCVVVRISAKSSYSLPNFFMPDKSPLPFCPKVKVYIIASFHAAFEKYQEGFFKANRTTEFIFERLRIHLNGLKIYV